MSNKATNIETVLKCAECKLSFKFLAVLESHTRNSHEPKTNQLGWVECSFCDMTFSTKRIRNFHYSQDHGISSLSKKTNNENPVNQTPCPECGKSLSWKYFKRHTKLFHSSPKPKSMCSKCDYEGEGPYLKTHYKRRHTDDMNQPCPFCGNLFKTLKRHIKYTNCGRSKEDFLQRVSCKSCHKSFSTKKLVTVHMKDIHNQVKDKQCPHCEYKTYKLGNLKLHVSKMHLGERI